MYTYKTERFVFNKLVNDQLTHGAVGGLTTRDIPMKLLFKTQFLLGSRGCRTSQKLTQIGKLIEETCGQDW